jgi:hypothetical protein
LKATKGWTNHQHELQTARQAGHVDHVVDTGEVGVHHSRTLLRGIQTGANSTQQVAQRLNLGFLGHALKVEQTLGTLVHDTLRQHAKLVQLTNELDETKTTTLRSSGNVVLIGKHSNLVGDTFGLGREVDLPATLELLLTAVEQVLAEQRTTSN